MVSMVSMVSKPMINKAAEIKRLLEEGHTTRQIAKELRVSLRDIHKVRQQENIDLGALQREKEALVKEISALKEQCSKLRQEKEQAEKDLAALLKEIERKKSELVFTKVPVAPIYFPENIDQVRSYLESRSDEQFEAIIDLVTNIATLRANKKITDNTNRWVEAEKRRYEK